jgi:hypothetical protein
MVIPLALVGGYALLLLTGGAFFLAAKPIAAATVLLGGLPSLLFVLLQYLIPVISFLGGLLAWRSIPVAVVLGAPLLPLSATVLLVGNAGPSFMGAPVPWPSAVALGSAGSTIHMLQTEALPYSVAFIAGLLIGVLGRVLFKPEPKNAA